MSHSQHPSAPTPPLEAESTTGSSRCGRPPCSRPRRLLFFALYGLYVGGLGWLAIFGYFWMQYDLPVSGKLTTEQLWQIHYPKLRQSGVESAQLSRNDGRFDVLLLGASVLEQVADLLEDRLRQQLGGHVRMYNLCTAAHTTRDSYWKFSRLAEKDFDLIIVYHGINDARMNCCPPGEFRDDYTHCSHYAAFVRQLAQGGATVTDVVLGDVGRMISLGSPDPEMLDFGRVVKTAGPFRENVETIVRASQARQRPVLLMTFAYHLPPDYTREAFQQRRLDYGDGQYQLEAELWGRPKHLAATIDAHNEQIRRLADEYPNVIFVDQARLMPHSGRYFSDPCHLTEEGCLRFADNVIQAIARDR